MFFLHSFKYWFVKEWGKNLKYFLKTLFNHAKTQHINKDAYGEHLLRDVELEFFKFYLWILPLLPSPTFSLRSKTLCLSGKCKGERRGWDQQIFCSGDPKLGLRRGLLPLGQNLLDLKLIRLLHLQSFEDA